MMKNAAMPKVKVQLGLIESGAFKGRRIVIPEDHNQTWAMVEKGQIFGQPNFHRACLIHEEFIEDQGCPKCATTEV